MRKELSKHTKNYSLLVSGTVELRVQVEADSLTEAEARACSKWTSLLGGHTETVKVLEYHNVT